MDWSGGHLLDLRADPAHNLATNRLRLKNSSVYHH